jgi:nicotinamide-nucleotide amidase
MIAGQLAAAVLSAAEERGWTIAVAESLTGGLVLAELTAVSGASRVVRGGVVAYQSRVKTGVLGVSATILTEQGAVSAEVVGQMARGVAAVCSADIGLATSGVAGPGSSDGVAAGTYWIGTWQGGSEERVLEQAEGDRSSVRQAAVLDALKALAGALDLV